MPRLKLDQLEEAKESMGTIFHQAVRDITLSYHKDLTAIRKEARRLEVSLQLLGERISRDLSGELRRGRRAGRTMTAAARKKIAQAMKKAWKRRKSHGSR